jgi:molybdopterin converting factor small subunit
MKCHLRFFGGVSVAANDTETTEFSFEGNTLGDLLDRIMDRWPDLEDYISGPGRGSVIYILNDKALIQINRALRLKEGDKLTIMPYIGGG